jgi:hypothetical protein
MKIRICALVFVVLACSFQTLAQKPTIVVYLAGDSGDTYLLYYTGTTYRGQRPSATNPVGETDALKLEAHRGERIGLATAKSPYGPWKRLDKPILDVVPNSWEQYLVSNAAPLILKDGRVMLYYKGVEKLRVNAIGLAVAECPTCEYKRISKQPLNMGIGAEALSSGRKMASLKH